MTNQRTSTYQLPRSETTAVSTPKYSLDATAAYGEYALDAQVLSSDFAPK
jgi:hypothetical protein